MSLRVEVGVDAGAAKRTVARLADRLAQPGPLFEAAADELRDIERERFAAQGPGWDALARSTVRRKLRAGQDPRILRATGELFDSLTKAHDPKALVRRQGWTLRFGTRLRKANALKRRRPFLRLDEARARRVSAAISDALLEEL